jgi:hypothetical protein
MIGCRITHYVIRDRSLRFVGPSRLFVNGKELGAVPRLAIGESRDRKHALLHCGPTWNVRGVEEYDSLEETRRAAERLYPGISQRWLATGISRRQAEAYRRQIWKGLECSFCGRLPDEIEQLVERRSVRICDQCIRSFSQLLRDDAGGEAIH